MRGLKKNHMGRGHQTHTQTHRHTDGHVDSLTKLAELAELAELVKIVFLNEEYFKMTKILEDIYSNSKGQ